MMVKTKPMITRVTSFIFVHQPRLSVVYTFQAHMGYSRMVCFIFIGLIVKSDVRYQRSIHSDVEKMIFVVLMTQTRLVHLCFPYIHLK